MSADRIEFFDYIEQLRRDALDVHHPSGQRLIHEYLSEMREADACDDAATVAKLARWIKEKIEQERRWQREDEQWEYGHDDEDESER